MLWPTPADYAQAVGGFPDVSLLDSKLNGGRPKTDSTIGLLVYSGGFSTVFPIEVATEVYALRCWTRDIGDAKNRYEKISTYLKQVRLPYFVDFEYVPEGILINGKKYPITRMEWSEGDLLRDFIDQNLQNATIFRTVANEFRKMVADLHMHRISHGDLQNGNILIKKDGINIEIKLIDYDSLFVPDLHGQLSPTPGLPEYQHPARGSLSNEKVDYFSELVIYLSFLSLSEKPDIWSQFGNAERVSDGLLFSKQDFENPDQSDVFQELANLSPDVQQLAATLKDFCAKTSLDELEPLEVILPRSDASTHCNRGESFLNDEHYNEALEEFQNAIDIEPDYARAYFGRGHVYRRTQRYANAITEFQQAINFNRNYKEAHYGLALAYFQSGDNSRAEASANAALRIDPSYRPARELLDFIMSTAPPSVRPTQPGPVSPPPRRDPPTPNPKPYASNSASNPGRTTPDPVPPTPKSETNVWQYLTFFFGIVLVVCAVVLAAQIDEKNAALRRVKAKELEIQQLSGNFQTPKDGSQTLEDEKRTLNSENKKLKSQLAEKETEIQKLTSRIRALQLPTRSSTELAGMVRIPAGDFRMGSNAAASGDEQPVHTVYVNAFYIDKYEVTNEEYKQFVDANPRWRKNRILRAHHDGNYLKHWTGNRYPDGKGKHPVTWVSWYASMAYAQWKGKRLPTEAEWEKAARGGLSSNNYLLNGLINSRTANYDRNINAATGVGNYQANPYGLYDMIGNVLEWCLDAYNSSFYANSSRLNPIAGGSIDSIVLRFEDLNDRRVLRGGSWSSSPTTSLITYRFTRYPKQTSDTIGFRCVRPTNP